MNNKETLAQRFNEILKAYGVLFSDDAMRSRLTIDLMSEVTQVTRQHPASNKLIHELTESLPEELQPLYCSMSPVPIEQIRAMLLTAFNDIANDQYSQAFEFLRKHIPQDDSEGTSEQASPTPEIAADPKVLRDVTAAVEDIKNGNTLSLEEAFQNVECGQFPPQYLTCPRSGCKGVVLFLQGGPPWRAYAYSCDESECPNHSKWLMFVDHYWGKAVYASPPVMSSILFLAPNVESHILDCIFRCSRCGQTKWGIWSDEATVGFYVHKHFDKELESEQLTFECDDCALKSKP